MNKRHYLSANDYVKHNTFSLERYDVKAFCTNCNHVVSVSLPKGVPYRSVQVFENTTLGGFQIRVREDQDCGFFESPYEYYAFECSHCGCMEK